MSKDLWLLNLNDERDGAALYEGMAAMEPNNSRAERFRELARVERRHATIWEKKLRDAGETVPPDQPSRRVRALLWLARRLGTQSILSVIVQNESGDAAKYAAQGGHEAERLADEERDHGRILSEMSGRVAPDARMEIASREGWHHAGRAGTARAAVFGMNDGLLSNLSLLLGVAGTGASPRTLLITGLSGLLAGASSMAVGEYISVASQRDLLKRQIELERRELLAAPEEEAAELALILGNKGLSKEQARRTAGELLRDPQHGLDTLVREELGLDPNDLGSPVSAATSSFVTFALGAIVPMIPFLFAPGPLAPIFSAGLAGGVLTIVGGLLGFLSGTSIVKSAGRMLLLASLAAGITYFVGRLFGVVV
jgi:VIT1/CCC1 family predicted Fe2+/Mn2+ transporter